MIKLDMNLNWIKLIHSYGSFPIEPTWHDAEIVDIFVLKDENEFAFSFFIAVYEDFAGFWSEGFSFEIYWNERYGKEVFEHLVYCCGAKYPDLFTDASEFKGLLEGLSCQILLRMKHPPGFSVPAVYEIIGIRPKE